MEMDEDSESGLIICNWHFEFNHLSDAVRGCPSDSDETLQQPKQGDSHIDGRIAVKLHSGSLKHGCAGISPHNLPDKFCGLKKTGLERKKIG